MIRLDLTQEQFRALLIACSKNPSIDEMEAVNNLMYDVLMKKLQKMVERDLYTKYKTAATEEEREQARQKYLEERDIPEAFRW